MRFRRSFLIVGLGCSLAAGVIIAANLHSAPPGTNTAKTRAPGPAARLNAWNVIGPGGGGTMIGPTLSPHDPNIVVEHCDMTGAYITLDGGLSWRMFNLRSVVSCFAFDPGNPEVIYAGNEALWRSENRGNTWRMILPRPGRNTREFMTGDHAEYSLVTDDPGYPTNGGEGGISAIAVDPANSNNLYIAFGGNTRAGRPAVLLSSHDKGNSWMKLHEFSADRVYALHLTSGQSQSAADLLMLTDSGVVKRVEGQWQNVPGPSGQKIEYASVGKKQGSSGVLIYATVSSAWKGTDLTGGIYVSADWGQNWQSANTGLVENILLPGQNERPRFGAIACAGQNAEVAYVGFSSFRLGQGRENVFNGIAKTSDGGKHWMIVNKESNRPSPVLEGSWLDDRAPDGYPSIWFDAPYSLGVAPGNPDICYATDLFRTYRTLNGGRSWQQVHSVRVGENRWTTRGLDVTTCYGVHFDPFDLQHLFITYTDIGLFQSSDSGKCWTGATEGIPNAWRNTTYWIAFDPEERDLLWGAFSGVHDLPRPKMWRGRNPSGYKGGVAVSADGGRRWTLSNQGMPETAVTHLLLDPASPRGSRTLYACGFGSGVYKSSDNGRTWVLKNAGIEKSQPFAWRITRAKGGTLYLVVARRSDRGRTGDAEDGALYRSIDGAEHWTKMDLPPGTNAPTSLVLDPENDGRIYLTAWGVQASGVSKPDTGGGVFVSTDDGQTWKSLFSRAQHIYDLTVDPRDPKILYVCGFDSAAYRSTDGGQSWTQLRGYNFKWGHRVVLDPRNRDKVYITTYGGSVWHGPAAGDPQAVGDILNPPE